jgi:hypothetical protein
MASLHYDLRRRLATLPRQLQEEVMAWQKVYNPLGNVLISALVAGN